MKWQKKEVKTKISSKLIDEYSLPPLVAGLFAARNIVTEEQLDFWLNKNVTDLSDPFLFNQMDLAVNRIFQALDKGEHITVYGDYDVDGITSTTVLVETLMMLGASVDYYIPDRFKDGYGPNLTKYNELIQTRETSLFITVDNGITGYQEISELKNQGIDVIVTDHHTLPEILPTDAVAIIHPKLPNQKYPFHDFSGVGVAYSLARALMDGDILEDLLDLVAIGTIADLVPLLGENHLIVKAGIQIIQQQNRAGLAELMQLANVNFTNLTATDIAFNIAPRLNSVGRIADANLAVKLLLQDDLEDSEIISIAAELEDDNNRRKELSEDVYQKAILKIKNSSISDKNTIIVEDNLFHEGVLGIVANRIVQEFGKPTIVLTVDDNGELKGSGRSIPGFDIFKALQPLTGNILSKFGGHTMACGLSLHPDNLEKLKIAFEASFITPNNDQQNEYDLEITPNLISVEEIKAIQAVGPFGEGNPEPIFAIKNPQITNFKRIGQNKEYFRFDIVRNGQANLSVVDFSKKEIDPNNLNSIEELYCTLSLNEWNNRVTPQLMLTDYEQKDIEVETSDLVIDLRKQRSYLLDDIKYIFFSQTGQNKFLNQNDVSPEQTIIYQGQNITLDKVMLVELPNSPEQLKEIFLKSSFKQVFLNFSINNLLVEQIPDDQRFREVLKYVYLHPNLSISDYISACTYLNTTENELKFIFNVFSDLNFVKINELKIIPIKQEGQTSLEDSKFLQATKQRLIFKKQLTDISTNDLVAYISSLMK